MSDTVTITLDREYAELNLRRFPTVGGDSALGLDQRALRATLRDLTAAAPASTLAISELRDRGLNAQSANAEVAA